MQVALSDTPKPFNPLNPGYAAPPPQLMRHASAATSARLEHGSRCQVMEKRAQPRFPIQIDGHITTPEFTDRPCTIRDFSASGMFIRFENESFELLPEEDEQLRPGAAVEVVFQLPGLGARVRVRATAARLMRCVFEDQLGIFFAKCNDTILQALIRESQSRAFSS